MDATEVESFVGNWGFEVSGTFGSSLGALWELVAVASIYVEVLEVAVTIILGELRHE